MSSTNSSDTGWRTLCAAGAASADRDAPPAEVLGIPCEYWSAPVSDARWRGVRPRLAKRLLLVPLVALVAAYISAAAASRGHLVAAGWLLALAVIAILAGGVALAILAHHLARYRAEAPR